ncbi:hypothetical protein H0H81_010591 [Sphagnurus paluster]|uniref:HAT C-terminal dimerisation domain-containing protein n=1 Tax=Sphagnurus paluster TaxID=117069 RepID=A0A9P7GIY9_9AGAR|nr:hypothetical protein H0H81_010591 [Sphagnurus paluster]
MASSVSSECAFSAAGITISKCRNRLKGDIVEALEILKCLLHQGLVFCHVAPTSDIETELEDTDDISDDEMTYFDTVKEADMFSWAQLVDEDDGEDSAAVNGDDELIVDFD